MTEDMDDALVAAAGQLGPPSDEQLAQVAELANNLVQLEDLLADLAERVKKVEAAKRELETKKLPDKLRELGLSEFKLKDGSAVGVKTVVSASVAAANRPAVNAWLRQVGHGDLVKHEVKAKFIRGQDALATELAAYLKGKGIEFVDDERVHPQTLSAWVRERVLRGEGESLPKDLLGIYIGQVGWVKRPEKAGG